MHAGAAHAGVGAGAGAGCGGDSGNAVPARLDENVGALRVKLTEDDVARISAAIPKGAAAGTRYPAGGMKGVYV